MNHPAVYFCSAYDPNPHSHGGGRRALQLWETLTTAGFSPCQISLKYDLSRSITTKIKRYLRGFIRNQLVHGKYRFGRANFPSGFYNFPVIKPNTRAVLVLENTHFLEGPVVAHQMGWKVVTVPQNIETFYKSLSPRLPMQEIGRKLSDEIVALAHSDAIFCIAREEQFCLRGFGYPAGYLPYYPPTGCRPFLLEVRRARASHKKTKFLIIGNANNLHNFLGMETSIREIQEHYPDLARKIVVVGFATEKLRPLIRPGSGLTILGELTESQLATELCSAIAVLIHQEYGFGSQTKITEMLMAGVPVIANEIAARSHFEYEGIFTYQTIREIPSLIENLPCETNFPDPPVNAEQTFVERIANLLESVTNN